MQKRTLPMYIFLNCITLGIYGFIVGKQMNEEINMLCKGDKQEPAVGYIAAVFIRLIPIFGAIYFNYWWYQQANRLKLNANRYGLTVKESGTDILLMRTVLEVPLSFVSGLEAFASLIVPAVVAFLFGLISPTLGGVFFGVFALVLLLFGAELTAGANVSNYYVMKNLNRFADVYRDGAAPFDPMAYEYYPTASSKYPNCIPKAIGLIKEEAPVVLPDPEPMDPPTQMHTSFILGMKGSCAGYRFDLNSGEEIIIGKDAKVASVVIDPAYKEVSRKHVSVSYDAMRNQYCITDYSSNGTYLNGEKLVQGMPVYAMSGAEIRLANGKNIFQLG